MLMKSFIKSNLKLQNYEIKIIKYVCLCFISETSKFFLLLLFFYFQNHIKEYLVSLLILLPLRWYSGGLHLKHYLSCLCASLIFFVMTGASKVRIKDITRMLTSSSASVNAYFFM